MLPCWCACPAAKQCVRCWICKKRVEPRTVSLPSNSVRSIVTQTRVAMLLCVPSMLSRGCLYTEIVTLVLVPNRKGVNMAKKNEYQKNFDANHSSWKPYCGKGDCSCATDTQRSDWLKGLVQPGVQGKLPSSWHAASIRKGPPPSFRC